MPTNKLPFRKAVGMNTLIREVLKEGRMAEAFNSRCIFRAWDLASGAAEFTVRRYFSDVKVQYAFKHVTLELEGNNLSGQKKYVMTRNTDMDIYHLEYDLRPRNFLVKLRFKIL